MKFGAGMYSIMFVIFAVSLFRGDMMVPMWLRAIGVVAVSAVLIEKVCNRGERG